MCLFLLGALDNGILFIFTLTSLGNLIWLRVEGSVPATQIPELEKVQMCFEPLNSYFVSYMIT